MAVINAELTELQLVVGLRKEIIFCSYYSAIFHRRSIFPCFKLRECTSLYVGSAEMGGGGRRIFVGVIKYFRHILLGHEMFFKLFHGSQNVFLCSIFVILFFKLRELEHKISKLATREI